MVSWTVSSQTDTDMSAYIAMRHDQDGFTLTLDEAIAELLKIGSIIKHHGQPSA